MGCSKCRSASGCTCRGYSGKPYYQCVDVCEEDHSHTEYCHSFSPAVCPVNSWNVPVVGGSALLSVPGLKQAPVGAYLWHSEYGYFEITSASSKDETIGVVNTNQSGNASPGTQIPECTCFVVTTPPAESAESSNVCVAVSFTAPPEDTPTDITVTSTDGLTGGDTVQIGSGFYFIEQIKPDNVITIVNQGEGIVPGTPVLAQDANGNYLNCLSVLSTNVCERDEIDAGSVIACADSTTAPLNVKSAGDVLYGVDADTNEAEFLPLDEAVPFCTKFDASVAVTAADATYTITVEDTSGFAVNDVLVIEGRTDRAQVTAVTNSTTLDITLVPTPGANSTIPVDTRICQIGCCEDIRDCVVQGLYFTVPAELYNQPIDLEPPNNYYEVSLDSTLFSATAPSSCPGSTYLVEAKLNVTAVIYARPTTVEGTDYSFTSEVQADWANNVGVGGRINWTGVWPNTASMPFSTGPFPTGSLNPVWNTLQLFQNDPPTDVVISYHGGHINAQTTLVAGASTALRLNLKVLTDDQFTVGDGEIVNAGVYVIGSVQYTKIT